MKTSVTAALIVAAGQGSRTGGGAPKQYQLLKGKPLLLHSIETFLAHPDIDVVQVVIGEGQENLYSSCCGLTAESRKLDAAIKGALLLPPVIGGDTRQASVRNGLRALAADRVLIHDAARPLASPGLIDKLIENLLRYRAVIPVLPVSDTLKSIRDAKVTTVDRTHLHRAQTPQAFDFALICELHERYADREATDDAMLAEWAGVEVGFVTGDERNLKITTALDFAIAEHL